MDLNYDNNDASHIYLVTRLTICTLRVKQKKKVKINKIIKFTVITETFEFSPVSYVLSIPFVRLEVLFYVVFFF